MALTLNRACMTTTTTGTGTVTLGEAVSPFQSLSAAGAINGAVYSYLIEDANGAWELGYGAYTSSGTTLSRTLDQSSTGSLLNLSGAARVTILERANDLPRLFSEIVTSGSVTSVTISSIPAGWRDLQIKIRGQSSSATNLNVQFNGDTGTNYYGQFFRAINTSTTTLGLAAQTFLGMGAFRTASGTILNAAEMTVFNYSNTTFDKATLSRAVEADNNTTSGQYIDINSGHWASTAAITSVKIFNDSTFHFIDGTVVSLYLLP